MERAIAAISSGTETRKICPIVFESGLLVEFTSDRASG